MQGKNERGVCVFKPGQKLKEVFAFWAIDKFLVCVTLTFDYKVISSIWNLSFILHTNDQSLCNLEAIVYLKYLMHVYPL